MQNVKSEFAVLVWLLWGVTSPLILNLVAIQWQLQPISRIKPRGAWLHLILLFVQVTIMESLWILLKNHVGSCSWLRNWTEADATIRALIPFLDKEYLDWRWKPFYKDTIRRSEEWQIKGSILSGQVSGGEKGVKLEGPSQCHAWWTKKPYELVSECIGRNFSSARDGAPCVAYIGLNGADRM